MTAPRLENRLPPEDLLDRDEHPLRELAWLLAGSLVVLALLVVATGLAARWLAPRVPFAVEVALAERTFDRVATRPAADAAARARQAALQAVADRVAATMDLPAGMRVVVTDDPSELVNAYATLGGRIRVFHGLLRKLDSEDALAALLAHEIAHVKHRHVAANMGHGLALALVLSAVAPETGARAAYDLLGGLAQAGLMSYTRDAERQADAEALAACAALYGHGAGMAALFATLPQEGGTGGPAWLRTHPETVERQAAMQAAAAARGWRLAGPVQPMPAALRELPARQSGGQRN